MTEIKGVDTIQGLVGEPSHRIVILKDTIKAADKLRAVWNYKHLAFLPYCFKCKEPVNWIQPLENGVIFRCPKCHREWVVE